MSKQIDDGGPAFPVASWMNDHGIEVPGNDGMSLRDWFAGQAPECRSPIPLRSNVPLLSDELWNQLTHEQKCTYLAGMRLKTEAEHLARWAYEYADAMLAARKESPNDQP